MSEPIDLASFEPYQRMGVRHVEVAALVRAVRAAMKVRVLGAVNVPLRPGWVSHNYASAAWLELRAALAQFTDSAEKSDG